ncbi:MULTISPECIES: hypothetical protein [unclassified Microbacterium]|uniref:hypothetical protein n=1 Tax=unclassified Microbacterium TaxID=2609290 RepID=UPI0020055B82|nr:MULTISPECIES: hypothetical protein [unclassified Microbacterium]
MTEPGAPLQDAPTRQRTQWLHAMTDRVPTTWFSGAAIAAFLAVAGAFGGLEAVAAPPVAELEPGQTHRNDAFELTVERAVLIDALPEAGAYEEEGMRVLAVVVTAENRWDRAVASTDRSALDGTFRARDLGSGEPESIARFDDTTQSPWLQPDLPVQVVVTWMVPADALADGDAVRLDIRDYRLTSGQFITSGESWEDPVTTAFVELEVTDVGAGADAESGDAG